MVVTTGAISHAKLQSNHHHQQTDTQFVYDMQINKKASVQNVHIEHVCILSHASHWSVDVCINYESFSTVPNV